MTAALLDRFTHRCAIVEMNGESYRLPESTGTSPRRQKSKEKASSAPEAEPTK